VSRVKQQPNRSESNSITDEDDIPHSVRVLERASNLTNLHPMPIWYAKYGGLTSSLLAGAMKMIVVLNIPDAAAHTAVALEERVNSAVRNFREIAGVEASVHRFSLFTDERYANNVKRL
jgi:hypothetical protein